MEQGQGQGAAPPTNAVRSGLGVALAVVAMLAVGAAAVAGLLAHTPVTDLAGLLIAATAAASGLLVSRARPRNPVGWMLLAAAAGLGVADALTQAARAGLLASPWLAWPATWIRAAAVLALFVLVPLHFPDGLPAGRRWRTVRRSGVALIAVVSVWVATQPGRIQMTDVANPLVLAAPAPVAAAVEVFIAVWLLVMVAAGVTSLVQRYRRGGRTQRSQVKWLGYAVAVGLVAIVLSWPAQALDPHLFVAVELVGAAAWTAVPVAIGVALLRHHLHDVDLVISRTLVYGTLTVAVATLYVVAVGYLGALLQARGSLLVSLLATGVVAVAFSPLRERLQRGVNRLLYGDRHDPYAAVDRLGRRLDQAASSQDLLDLAAVEVAAALRLPYVAIELAAPAGPLTVACHGAEPAGRLERIDLHFGGVRIGWLAVGPLTQDDQLSAADRCLLDALARPVGATLHAHTLSTDLQRSREALVTAREEERSRLHRDLHDGLGPDLATVSMLAEAAGDAVRADPVRAAALLGDLVERAQQAVADLRSVVNGLRPPALDALGLVGALRAYAATHTRRGLGVSVHASTPLPVLPAAVEVAAYRIATEALTNVTRHADATACSVRLTAERQRLVVEVVDDGRGVTAADAPGVGLRSMQTRAAELGGHCVVAARPEGGTMVHAWLPLAAADRTTPAAVPIA